MPGSVEVVKRVYEAFLSGDWGAVTALVAPDVSWEVPPSLPGGGAGTGPGAVISFFEALGEAFQEISLEPEGLVEAGAQVFVLGTTRARTAVGTVEAPSVHVWDVADGKVTRFREFTDTAALAAILARERRLDTTGE